MILYLWLLIYHGVLTSMLLTMLLQTWDNYLSTKSTMKVIDLLSIVTTQNKYMMTLVKPSEQVSLTHPKEHNLKRKKWK